MQLNGARIVLTGATGGLGEALARALAKKGAVLLLTGRDPDKLARLQMPAGSDYRLLRADLGTSVGIDEIVAAARQFEADVLINNAGVGGFGLLDEQDGKEIERILRTNLEAPIQLTRSLLPQLRMRPAAAVVNIGSAFGSIPFAGFAAYSAAKAGLRGFSQALRRELADSRVEVFHIAPRAIDTPLNSPAVNALNQALGNASDSPEKVAAAIVDLLACCARERVLGFPERLFAWLNGLAPALVDGGVKGKLAVIKRHAAKKL